MKTPGKTLSGMSGWLDRWGIVLILVIFVSLAFGYSVINPNHEATDELRHYRFVRTIATTGKLPVQGQEACRSQSHHPPLFYAIGALATFWIDTGRGICETPPENPFWAYRYWEVGRDNKNQYLHGPDEAFPWSGEALAVHIIRSINILFGAGVVFLTWRTGKLIWPRQPAISLVAAALVAFNPMFLYMSGAINNDIIAAFSGSLIVVACVNILMNPEKLNWRWAITLGFFLGIALLSKFNLAAMIVLILLLVTWVVWKGQSTGNDQASELIDSTPLLARRLRFSRLWTWIRIVSLIFITAFIICGWWFIRNEILYGEPTGFQELTELWGVRDPSTSFGLAWSELPYAWTTLWGRFGFGQIPLPQVIYSVLGLVMIAGTTGAVFSLLRYASRKERIALLFLTANVGLFFLVLFNYMLISPAGPNGRFFFPALSSMMLFIAYGLIQVLDGAGMLIRRIKGETHQIDARSGGFSPAQLGITVVVNLGMLSLSLLALVNYLLPAYARPSSLAEDASIPNQVNISFDHLVTLLGYDLSKTSIRPGEFIDLELYWEVTGKPPGNYLLFVHLIDSAGTIVAQRDTHPGLGNFASSLWRPGDRFAETIRLYMPETAYTPERAEISVGLYEPGAYRLATWNSKDQSLGDSVSLGIVSLLPLGTQYPNFQSQRFENEITLVGYQYDRRLAKSGEVLIVTLFWDIPQDIKERITVEVRLRSEDDQEWGMADAEIEKRDLDDFLGPDGGIIEDVHYLAIGQNAPPGRYSVVISIRDQGNAQYLNMLAEDGHWIDTHLKMAQLIIE